MEIPVEIKSSFRPDVGLEVYDGVIDLEVRGQGKK